MQEREKGEGDLGYLTLPVRDIDLKATMDRSLSREERPRAYIEDATTVATAAACFAGECMAAALGELVQSIDTRGGQAVYAGWNITQERNSAGNAFSLVLTRNDTPGAWHLGVQFEKKHSEAGAELKDRMRKERGQESMKKMLDRIINPDPADALFEADPANFRPAEPGDHVHRINGTALVTGAKDGFDVYGPPPRVHREECMEYASFLKDTLRDSGWWPGIAMLLRPTRKTVSEFDRQKWTVSGGMQTSHIFLSVELLTILSEVIKDAGFEKSVAADFEAMLDRKLWSASNKSGVLREEVGVAAVRESGGFMDGAVRDINAEFSARLTARVIETHAHEIIPIFNRLFELGYTSKENEYDCNDMRDISHVVQDEDGSHLFLRTQNGRFRFDYNPLSGDMQGWRFSTPDRLVGAFTSQVDLDGDPGSLIVQPGWLGTSPSDPGHVAYTQIDVQGINQLIMSMSSISCCLEMDHPEEQSETPDPGM